MIVLLLVALLMVYLEVTARKEKQYPGVFYHHGPCEHISLLDRRRCDCKRSRNTFRPFVGKVLVSPDITGLSSCHCCPESSIYDPPEKERCFFSLVFLWAALGIIVARRSEMSLNQIWWAVTAMVTMGIVFIFILIARFVYIKKEKITAG